ncbi:MAG: chemotaxis protein CheW [Acidobacteriota bacterium]
MAASSYPEYPAGEYLTFRIGRNEFAMESSCLRGMLPGHEVVVRDEGVDHAGPQLLAKGLAAGGQDASPEWFAGKTMFKGTEIDVIDLRAKLRLRRGVPGRNPCVVIVDTSGFGDSGTDRINLIGFLVDGVSELVKVRPRDFNQGKLRIGRPRQVLGVGILMDETRELETVGVA